MTIEQGDKITVFSHHNCIGRSGGEKDVDVIRIA